MSRFVLFLALFWVAFAYSQPKEPQLPSVDFDPGYGVGFPVSIELFNKGRLSGYIIFESEQLLLLKKETGKDLLVKLNSSRLFNGRGERQEGICILSIKV
jgi:hypothetical protein